MKAKEPEDYMSLMTLEQLSQEYAETRNGVLKSAQTIRTLWRLLSNSVSEFESLLPGATNNGDSAENQTRIVQKCQQMRLDGEFFKGEYMRQLRWAKRLRREIESRRKAPGRASQKKA